MTGTSSMSHVNRDKDDDTNERDSFQDSVFHNNNSCKDQGNSTILVPETQAKPTFFTHNNSVAPFMEVNTIDHSIEPLKTIEENNQI